jgi:hypothetical protein
MNREIFMKRYFSRTHLDFLIEAKIGILQPIEKVKMGSICAFGNKMPERTTAQISAGSGNV